MPVSPTDILGATIVVIGGVAVVIYRLITQPVPSGPKLISFRYRCPYCSKGKPGIAAVCTNVNRQAECQVEKDHMHMHCQNCEAKYLMQPETGFQRWWREL